MTRPRASAFTLAHRPAVRPGARIALGLALGLLIALCLLLPAALRAGEKRSDPRLSLHQVSKACGKKWLERAERLSPEQWEWMLRTSHGLYKVEVGGRTVMTVEVFSAPSFRDCDVETQWARKETTARFTYQDAAGATRVRLVHFASDETFFNQKPSIMPGAGRALLKGVTASGAVSNRWIELEPIREPQPDRPVAAALVAQARPGR